MPLEICPRMRLLVGCEGVGTDVRVIRATEICVALPVMAGSFLSERLDHLRMREWGQGGGLSRGSREEVVRASWRSKGAQNDSRARRGGSDCRQPVQLKRCRPPRRVSRWPAVPPRTVVKVYSLGENSSGIFIGRSSQRVNCAGWTWLAPHVAVIQSSSEYSRILMICDGSQSGLP